MSKNNAHNADQREREEIEALLPWFATGKLSGADAARVSAYLDDHPDIAWQMELVREERNTAVRANEALGAPSPQAFDKLMASIASGEAASRKALARPPARASWRSAAREFFAAPTPGGMRWALAAAIVLALTAGVIIGGYASHEGGDRWRPAHGQDSGAVVHAVFAETAPVLTVTKFLRAEQAMIIEGPMPDGVYKIRFRRVKDSETTDLITRLSARKDIFTLVRK